MEAGQQARGEVKHLHLSDKARESKKVNYEEKLNAAFETNFKLKQLWEIIRNNALSRKMEESQVSKSTDNHHLLTLQKKHKRLSGELQQLTNNLNCLVNQNNKLKGQVDTSRNSRVIYSNIYKNLEKEIHRHEYLYKTTLIEGLCYQEAQSKVKERFEKTVRTLEREINELESSQGQKRKLMKKKSRLDTGLSTIRSSTRVLNVAIQDNKNTSRESRQPPSVRGLDTKKEEGQAKKQMLECKPITNDLEHPQLPTNRTIKTRTKLQLAEQINEYYDLEMKSNYYDNVILQLRNICGGETIDEVSQLWKGVQQDINKEFRNYEQIEENIKKIEEEIKRLSQNRQPITSRTSIGGKTAEEQELEAIEEEMKDERARLQQLEGQISVLMDLNCHKLTDEQISNHILRIKRRGAGAQKELDKLLESVSKEKSMPGTVLQTSRMSRG